MSNRLNIPEDLNALIEKREQEDRRQKKDESSQHLTGQAGQPDSLIEEKRSGKDRRTEDNS